MKDANPDLCPKLYECAHIRKAPMIRALLGCTAQEAMKSICATCPECPDSVNVLDGAEALATRLN